jgi:hypothetical protein
MQHAVLIAGSGEEVWRLDLDVGPEDVAECWEATAEEISFGVRLGEDDHCCGARCGKGIVVKRR